VHVLIFTQLINGLVSGALLTLIAIGVALTFGLLKVVNLSHAAIYTLGAYIGLTTFQLSGNFWIGIILAGIITGIVGVFLERLCIRQAYQYPVLGFLITFALLMGLTQAIRVIWGPGNQLAPQPAYLTKVVYLGFIPISSYRLFAIFLATCIMTAVWILISKTNIGLIVRASLDNKAMVDSFGVNSSLIFTFVFGLGSAIAGVCGVLGSPIFGLFPDVGTQMLVLCFVVVVMGGLGSIRGAMLAGPIIGVVISFSALVSAGFSDAIIFILMAGILLAKPMGFFGDKL
jgi:branched-subunit amino acid ABC-type transport system permease component